MDNISNNNLIWAPYIGNRSLNLDVTNNYKNKIIHTQNTTSEKDDTNKSK